MYWSKINERNDRFFSFRRHDTCIYVRCKKIRAQILNKRNTYRLSAVEIDKVQLNIVEDQGTDEFPRPLD